MFSTTVLARWFRRRCLALIADSSGAIEKAVHDQGSTQGQQGSATLKVIWGEHSASRATASRGG